MDAATRAAGAAARAASGDDAEGNVNRTLRLLLLDDSRFDAVLLEDRLRRDGLHFVLHRVWDEAGFRAALDAPWDLVVSELDLHQFSARAALALLAERGVHTPLVILTANEDERALAGAVAAGAVDYVLKTRLGRLTQALRLAIERGRLIERLNAKQRRMAVLSQALVQAQEAERKALARELHDELGQRLTALNMLLHRARPWFADTEGQTLWNTAEHEMTQLIGMIRDLSASLRPPGLDLFGLQATIEQLLARRFENGPAWVLEYAGLPHRLAPVIEITVYRIVQESVTNIVRHANAHQVVVEINGGAHGDELELIVRDDGTGFDARRWRERGARDGRAGLAGMSERVQLLGGTFEVASRPGGGTRIVAVIPLRPEEAP